MTPSRVPAAERPGAPPPAAGSGEVHLFEPTGYAGVFQHACRLGDLLAAHGLRVVLHTGHQHEDVLLPGVQLCPCSWWPRHGGPRPVGALGRQVAIGAALLGRTLPHLHRAVPDGAVLHVQGVAPGGALTGLLLLAARLSGRRVVHSPHDTFSRRGPLDGALLRLAARVPHAVVVHSGADRAALRARGIAAGLAPLVQHVPLPSEAERLRWRRTWQAGPDDAVVLFAGFIRSEKRLDVLVEAARTWPPGRRLAVVGPDRGEWARCRTLAAANGVDVAAHVGFVELPAFVAAVAAADVVVVPSALASQSGVLAVARLLGVRTLAANVGGMPELATATFAAGDPSDLNRALDALLAGAGHGPDVRTLDEEAQAVRVHLRAYGRVA